MKRVLLFTICFWSFFIGFGQETIDVQRPTLTESRSIIGRKIIQFESGTQYDISNQKLGYSVFSRFGVNDRLELRFATDLMNQYLDFSGKVMLFEGKGALPGMAVTLTYDLLKGFQDFRFCATNGIGEKLFYTLNIANDRNWYGILLLGTSIGEKGAVFAEYAYNELGVSTVNSGATYIIKGEVQLDVHGGFSSFAGTTSPYVGGGVSFRLK